MRRSDREVTSREWIGVVLKEAEWLTIGVCGENRTPALAPVPFVYAADRFLVCVIGEDSIYDMLKANPKVCFQAVSRAEVIRHDSLPSKFSMRYKSVTGFGQAQILQDAQQAEEARRMVLERFAPAAAKRETLTADRTKNVIKVEIEEVFGKSNGYQPEK